MGIWDFVKDAGKSVFGSAEAAESKPIPQREQPAPQPEAAAKPQHDAETQRKLDALIAEVKALGLGSKDVRVHLNGDTVTVVSKGADRETMEKLILAVGNIKGIAKVEADLPEDPNAKAEPVFHEVKKGENLSQIAKKYLGDANKYHAIFEANKPMLTHPDKIYPGQMLRIPQE